MLTPLVQSELPAETTRWQETAEVHLVPPPPPRPPDLYAFVICSGDLIGRSFLLERPLLTIGRGGESDVVINDASISRRHAQIVRQPHGDYVQDLASRNGTTVNGEPLTAPRLLAPGDLIRLGSVALQYVPIADASGVPLMTMHTQPLLRPNSGPVPLRLPSRQPEL
jgi:hypothetical protein